MSILVTFADGHSTLVASREAAEQIAAYWPQLHATIRDLDQEARDREEMIAMLEKVFSVDPASEDEFDETLVACGSDLHKRAHALLKRLGRLP